MSLEVVPVRSEHVPELGRICYEAFKDISERHGFRADFAIPAVAEAVISALTADENVHSVAAMLDGRLIGSNFLSVQDDVGAVGPITVDPAVQGGGVGRRLMEDVLKYARENGVEMVRLVQDSFNMRSLALYASLGFDTKEPLGVMDSPTEPAESPRVRPLDPGDLDAVERLSRDIYRVSRRHEVEHMSGGPFPAFVVESEGRVRGYFVAGIAGHGVAESEELMVELVMGTMALVPALGRVFFCPLPEANLYRRFLAAGATNRKVMNLMALGPYEEPQGVWLPSVGF
jgi:GNAT superfamily N-acetyltransferase